MCACGVVGELGDRYVVAVADFEEVPLNAGQEDECIGVFDTVTIPYANKEGHPVEIETVVEVVEGSLVLIDEVGRNDGGAQTQGGCTALFGSEVDHTAGMSSELDGDAVFAVEALVGAAEVLTGDAGIPARAVDHDTCMEVGEPFAGALRWLSGGLVDETLCRVDLVGEVQVVEIPLEVNVKQVGLEGDVHEDFAREVEAEGIHDAQEVCIQRTVVALTVGEDDCADATVQFVDILVVGQRNCRVGADECGPLAAVGQRETGGNLRTGHSRVKIQRIGIELRKADVLGFYALHSYYCKYCDYDNPECTFFHIFQG